MRVIAFHSNQLSVTGTEVALFDYAHYNEAILGNKSLVLYQEKNPNNHPEAVKRFADRFPTITYRAPDYLDQVITKIGADLLYALKAGRRDHAVSRRVPTMVHAVFPTAPWQVHGSSFAFISEWLSQTCSGNQLPTVPHIVEMPKVSSNLRLELQIPDSALVLGCYGGAKSFDVPCAIEAVESLLMHRADFYIVFMNLIPFLRHPRAIFLEGSSDVLRKSQFINTCDIMAHARMQGESFGLACGEFSVLNRPILTYRFSKHTHHHEVLGNKGFYYGSKDEFIQIVSNLSREKIALGNWDCYTERYNPERVMEAFDQHLIWGAEHPRRRRTSSLLKATCAFVHHKISYTKNQR